MKINEIIRSVYENTLTEGGNRLKWVDVIDRIHARSGKKISQATLSDRLKNENMTMNTAIEILDTMGYDVMVVPREKGRETYKVEMGEKRRGV